MAGVLSFASGNAMMIVVVFCGMEKERMKRVREVDSLLLLYSTARMRGLECWTSKQKPSLASSWPDDQEKQSLR